MGNKTVLFVSCFDEYDSRLKYVENFFLKRNYSVRYLVSDFFHIEKKYISEETIRNNVKLIHVPSYKKNLSFQRLRSHFVFSKKVYDYIRKSDLEIDLIYANLPPNSLMFFLSKIKRIKKIKLFIDIYDMWPESLTCSKKIKKCLFPWGLMRNLYLKYADTVITECDLYHEKLPKKLSNVHTLYLTKECLFDKTQKDFGKELQLCYLGSINNIMDMDLLLQFITRLSASSRVILNIIGGGEKKNLLLKLLSENNIEYNDYGIIFDNEQKRKIFEKCHFGINLMKKEVYVGLTMKSIDYFCYGIPIINNIREDTERIVNQYNCGYNLSYENMTEIVNSINSLDSIKYNELMNNVKKAYYENFSIQSLENKFLCICDSLFI